MRRWLILPLVASLILLLGALLLVFDAVNRLYSSIFVLSPLLANGLALILGLLVLVALSVLIYYGWLFLRPRRRRTPPQPPRSPAAAASARLDVLQQQVAQIHDQVARQALMAQQQVLAQSMAEQDFRITVFGVGSAGKTSLVNALLHEAVGEVAAPMGTTTASQTYRWVLPGIKPGILLVDTPGISEVGAGGSLREQDGRQLATQADLLLFVVDDDLRQSEYSMAQSLLAMGKRLLLVLNKADRFADSELDLVLERLRSRFSQQLAPEDVLAVAANPPPIPAEGGGWFHLQPNLDPLLARLADVLQAEGSTLIADNILLQSQQLGETARQLIDDQRTHQAEAIVERYQWIGAGAMAITPLPGLDLLAAAAVNTQMIVELGKVYSCDLSIEEGKALAISLAKTLTGLGIAKGAVELLSLGLQTNVATILAGRALQGVSGAYLTRIAGKSFIEYFRHNQDWGDGGMDQVVSQQFRLNQRDAFMQAFLRDALAAVVPMLQVESQRKSKDSSRPPETAG